MNESQIVELINVLKEVRINQNSQTEEIKRLREDVNEIKTFIQELKDFEGGDGELNMDAQVIIDGVGELIKPVDIKVDAIRDTLLIKTDREIIKKIQEQRQFEI